MKKLSTTSLRGAILTLMLVGGCSPGASAPGTDSSATAAIGAAASATIKCAACSAEVAKADAVTKDGKQYCAACAGKM